jgi:hypothetical protein
MVISIKKQVRKTDVRHTVQLNRHFSLVSLQCSCAVLIL